MNIERRPIIEGPDTARDLARLEFLATWLDRRFLDPAAGFFLPGAGGTLCSLLGLYGVYVAVKMSLHPIIIARMLINLAIDSIFGGIPILGTVFDIFYRANIKNLNLIKERGSYGAPTWGDFAVVLSAAFFFLIALLLPLLLVGALVVFLMKTFF